MRATIYVNDRAVWQAAKEAAAAEGVSLSEFIMQALHGALEPSTRHADVAQTLRKIRALVAPKGRR